jgi:GNAT superfamily N-acetyltransferase
MAAVRWAALVGRRVVVRHRIPGGLTDVLGELLDAGDTVLVVRTARGDVRVPVADVVAGKEVPPRPTRAAPPHLALSVTDLVAVMARHWNPADSTRLGGWWLRAAGGFTNRANCVIPLGDPGVDADAAESFARDWFARRGLPATVSVAGPAPGGVPDGDGPTDRDGSANGNPDDDDPTGSAGDGSPAARAAALLRARGWAITADLADGSALVLTAPTAELLVAGSPGSSSGSLPAGLTLDVSPVPDSDWLATYRYRGQPVPEHAVELLLSAPEQAFWSVRDGGRTVAVARGSLADGWAGVTAVDVDPSYRRRGLARALLAAVAGWAWRRGAASTFLQTAESNTAAQRLYLAAGFAPHHRYAYLRAPSR